MVRFGIPIFDELLKYYSIVELEGDWVNHVVELADLIMRSALKRKVYILFYVGREFMDLDQLYSSLEPIVRNHGNIEIRLVLSISSLIFNISYICEYIGGNTTIYLILPYPRDMPSHTSISFFPELEKIIRSSIENGVEVIIINPMNNRNVKWKNIYLADITLRLEFYEDGTVLVEKEVEKPLIRNLDK